MKNCKEDKEKLQLTNAIANAGLRVL